MIKDERRFLGWSWMYLGDASSDTSPYYRSSGRTSGPGSGNVAGCQGAAACCGRNPQQRFAPTEITWLVLSLGLWVLEAAYPRPQYINHEKRLCSLVRSLCRPTFSFSLTVSASCFYSFLTPCRPVRSHLQFYSFHLTFYVRPPRCCSFPLCCLGPSSRRS